MIEYLKFRDKPSLVFSGLHMPPTTNNLRQPARVRGAARLISTPGYRDWKLMANRWLALGASRNIIPVIAARYALSFLIGMHGKDLTTSADMANREKAVVDVMVSSHILPQDSMKFIVGEEFAPINAFYNPFGFAFVMVSYWEQDEGSGNRFAAELSGTKRIRVDDDGQGN